MAEDNRAATSTKDSSSKLPRVDGSTMVGSTKWLQLETLTWTGPDGVARAWDCASRTTKKDESTTDAVVVIPLLRNNTTDDEDIDTLLVEQFRPPVRTTTVEFPAGLIDKDETVEQAALRELREETGYVGEACKVAPLASKQLCMSPGLCNETVQVVLVEVDMSNPYNSKNPTQELDEGEFCSVKRVSLKQGLKSILDDGSAMPIKGLYLFALGWELGRKAATSKP